VLAAKLCASPSVCPTSCADNCLMRASDMAVIASGEAVLAK
jgi:hypothetical protein